MAQKFGEKQLCNMPEVTVEQMTFGGRGKVGRPEIADKKIHKTIRVRKSVLKEIGNRNFTQIIELCYLSSKTVQPSSYVRTNYHRSLEPSLSSTVTSILSDDHLQQSMKVDAIMGIMSGIAENRNDTGFIVSGP